MTKNAVAKKQAAELARIQEETVNAGLDHIGKDDMALPRLALAQGLSPQVQKKDPKFIKGLSMGEAFNTLTEQNYGEGPWDVAIVRADPPRFVEFIPRDAGGGVKDPDVDPKDPRAQWTVDKETGKRVKPKATMFYDYVVVFLDTEEALALSFKSTGLRTARTLNSLMRLRQQREKIPFFWGKYQLRVEVTTNTQGTFAVLLIKNNGQVEDDELKIKLHSSFQAFKDKELKFEREEGDTEGEDVAAEETKGNAKVPF